MEIGSHLPSSWACRALSGAIGPPTRICGAAVSGATKDSANPRLVPRSLALQGLPFLQADRNRLTTAFVVPGSCFLFLIPDRVPCRPSRCVTTSRCCTLSTGLDSALGETTNPQRQRHSRHVSVRPAAITSDSELLATHLLPPETHDPFLPLIRSATITNIPLQPAHDCSNLTQTHDFISTCLSPIRSLSSSIAHPIS